MDPEVTWLRCEVSLEEDPQRPKVRDCWKAEIPQNPAVLPVMAVFFELDPDGYMRQLLSDAHFLCSHQRMDTELLDKLVLQLNRTYPQVLSDKEAHKFRNVRVLTKLRFAELLRNLHCKGEEACHEFYRGIQIHAEDLYCKLPSRVTYREMEAPKRINGDAVNLGPNVLNDKGPVFFLSCFSLVVGVAILYYCREKETLNCTVPWLHCSARKLSKGAKQILLSYAEMGKHNI